MGGSGWPKGNTKHTTHTTKNFDYDFIKMTFSVVGRNEIIEII